MRRILWHFGEALIVLAMILALQCGRCALRWAAGLNLPDQELLAAAGGDDPVALRDALERGGSPLARDPNDSTPLMNAAVVGHIDFVRVLIERGADVNAVDKYGQSALFYATRANRAPVVRLLLAHGADPTLCDRLGDTALNEAEYFHATEVAEVLRSEFARACPRHRH